MAVPKHKKSKSRRDMRRSQHKIGAVQSSACPQCGEAKLPHRVCPTCGSYDGREVVAKGKEQNA